MPEINKEIVVYDPNPDHLGPAMLALTPLQRRFVLVVVEMGVTNLADAALIAGYNASQSSNPRHSAAQYAYIQKNNDAVKAAIKEEIASRLEVNGAPIALQVLIEIAKDAAHKDRLKAAGMLLNRTGFHEKTEHKVTVEHVTDSQMIAEMRAMFRDMGHSEEEIRALLKEHKVEVPTSKVVDAEYEVVPAKTVAIDDFMTPLPKEK